MQFCFTLICFTALRFLSRKSPCYSKWNLSIHDGLQIQCSSPLQLSKNNANGISQPTKLNVPNKGQLLDLVYPNARDKNNLEQRMDWIQERLKLDNKTLIKVVKKHPSILYRKSDENWEPKLLWLQERLELNDTELSKLVKMQPQVMSYRIEENMKPKLVWLQERLQLNDRELAKMIKSLPAMLGNSIEDNMEPKLVWLQERLKLNDKELCKLVKTLPSVVGYSVEENLETKFKWLKQNLQLDNEQVAKLIRRKPQILCYSIEDNIIPTLRCLQEELDLMEDNGAIFGCLVEKFPQILGYSIENNLRPTIQFYKDCIGHEVACAVILNDPSFLGRSLKKRLEPRLIEAEKAGIVINPGVIKRMAKYTDEEWTKSIEFQKRQKLQKSSW